MTAYRKAIAAALFGGSLGLVVVGGAVAAPELPCRTARLIVSYGAGGGSDLTARVVAEAANRLGASPTLQVVNIEGQGGATGIKEAAAAAPDGCTVLFQHQAILTHYLSGRVKFSWDGFEPIANIAHEPLLVGAAKKTPYNDLKELQEYGKKNEVIGSATLGSDIHFNMLELEKALGIKFKMVPYDGARERVTALLAGNIDITSISEANSGQYLKKGELKALAIAYDKRSPSLPDLTTAKEQGFNLQQGSTFGVLLPKKTPKAVVDYYADLFAKVAADPGVQASLQKLGLHMNYMPPAEYAAFWKKTQESWVPLAKSLGLYHVKE